MNNLSSAPLVTVAMSAFNDEEYITQAIDSILSQTYTNIEFLIGNDGSTDRTAEIIQSISKRDRRVSFYNHSNRGKAATLNHLLSVAKGKYFVIQDSDDSSAPDRLEILVKELEMRPHLAMLLSGHALILDDNIVAPKVKSLDDRQCEEYIKCLQLPAHDPTMIVKTEIAKKFLFNPALKIGQGVDFIFRIAEKHSISVIDKCLYHYRVRTDSVTKKDPVEKSKNLLRVMNLAKERRGEKPWSEPEFLRINSRWAKDKYNNLSGHFTESAYQSVMKKKRFEAWITAAHSLAFALHGFAYLKPAIYALSPRFLCDWGKKKFGMS
ncbi:glycosyltransferase family A protein [Microbulbifer sp. ALW1]|uniref:glycosyltransferase family 2 protein n=1 Tax=Microbulbifer sp. (strain ALW1) TaxID=1516059 RepID=UPI0013573765|nr:glycosyltransferase family A protein [Microbulbifer sp. ALW1]